MTLGDNYWTESRLRLIYDAAGLDPCKPLSEQFRNSTNELQTRIGELGERIGQLSQQQKHPDERFAELLAVKAKEAQSKWVGPGGGLDNAA
jgi:hypothetical protein